jgi:SAM-dependent methyltransferase
MSDGTLARSYGKVFNEVAVEYDRNRPTYPDALVDQACEVAGIRDGDSVLEIGCGTGQLTRSLLARGLRVTALEPGDQLIRVAEENLKDAGDVEFIHARLENAQLSRESYETVFSASAIHWVDPDLSWRKIADELGALLGTMSFWARLSPDQRDALANENHALYERLGRPIRTSTLAALLTARRCSPMPQR